MEGCAGGSVAAGAALDGKLSQSVGTVPAALASRKVSRQSSKLDGIIKRLRARLHLLVEVSVVSVMIRD